MERKQPKLPEEFEDLATCAEYYFDLIGSFEQVEQSIKSKKSRKKVYGHIESSFFAALENLKERNKLSNTVGKTELKEYKEEFQREHGIRTFGEKLRDAGRKVLGIMSPKGNSKPKNPDDIIAKQLEEKSSSPALENTQTESEVFDVAPDEEKPSEVT